MERPPLRCGLPRISISHPAVNIEAMFRGWPIAIALSLCSCQKSNTELCADLENEGAACARDFSFYKADGSPVDGHLVLGQQYFVRFCVYCGHCGTEVDIYRDLVSPMIAISCECVPCYQQLAAMPDGKCAKVLFQIPEWAPSCNPNPLQLCVGWEITTSGPGWSGGGACVPVDNPPDAGVD